MFDLLFIDEQGTCKRQPFIPFGIALYIFSYYKTVKISIAVISIDEFGEFV